MKASLLLSVFVLISFQITFAQSSLEFVGGYTYAWPGYGDTELPPDAETSVNGYNFSLSYHYQIKANWKIGVSTRFSKRGARCFPGFQNMFVGDTEVRLSYLDFPITLIKSDHLFDSPLIIDYSVGYGISTLLSAELLEPSIDAWGNLVYSSTTINEENGFDYNNLDHGLHLGLGINYPLSDIISIVLRTSFYNGFVDFDRLNTSKNRSIDLNLGWSMSL